MDAATAEKLAAAHSARLGGEYDTALELYQAVVAADADCIEAIHGLALARMWGSGEFDEGIEMLEHAVTLAPDNQLVLLELAKSYAMLGEDEKAKPLLDKVVAIDATTKEGQEALKQLQYYA